MTGILPFLGLLYYNIQIYGKIRESTRHECHRWNSFASSFDNSFEKDVKNSHFI
jgi:hypothetical protein